MRIHIFFVSLSFMLAACAEPFDAGSHDASPDPITTNAQTVGEQPLVESAADVEQALEVTAAGPCGYVGQACCAFGGASFAFHAADKCSNGSYCDDFNQCQRCGGLMQPACPGDHRGHPTSPFHFDGDHCNSNLNSSRIEGWSQYDTCGWGNGTSGQYCGSTGQECCRGTHNGHDGRTGAACSNGNYCDAGRCQLQSPQLPYPTASFNVSSVAVGGSFTLRLRRAGATSYVYVDTPRAPSNLANEGMWLGTTGNYVDSSGFTRTFSTVGWIRGRYTFFFYTKDRSTFKRNSNVSNWITLDVQ